MLRGAVGGRGRGTVAAAAVGLLLAVCLGRGAVGLLGGAAVAAHLLLATVAATAAAAAVATATTAAATAATGTGVRGLVNADGPSVEPAG